MTNILEKELSYTITGLCFQVHRELGRFCRERQYQIRFEQLLKENNIPHQREINLRRIRSRSPEGNLADFVIDGKIVIEFKAKNFVTKEDYVQIQRYLQSSGIELGMLINFRQPHIKPKRVLNTSLVSDSEHSDPIRSIRIGVRGYTLLEVLIASALFVGVLMIGTSSFTTASRLRERTLDQQQTTETARFIAETIARDVRSATGQKGASGYGPYPFEFVQQGNVKKIPTDGLIQTSGLRTYRFDASKGMSGGLVERLYEFSADNGQMTVRRDGGDPQSLLPDGFSIKDVSFEGLSHNVVGLLSQPFVRFQLTVVSKATGNTQTIRTAVASREVQ